MRPSRRFWISVGLGAVLGGSAVLGFGPCVRAQASRRAAAYGAHLQVQAVAPSWRGVRLRGVELAIDELPAVAESAVVGVPHPDFGEAVTAVVVPRPGSAAPTEAEVIAWLKSRLANFKVPKRVYVVEELPRNTMGKVQKNVLRDRYARPGA